MNGDSFSDCVGAYALGVLEADEHAAFEAHLDAGCPACARELDGQVAALSGLAQALPVPEPGDGQRQQLLDLSRAPALPADLGELEWREIAPGINLHTLWEDPARGVRACLAWARPGAKNLLHRHHGDENILVLRGGLKDERGSYWAGDLCRSRAGSIHTEEVLPGDDCVCYVVYYGDLEPV